MRRLVSRLSIALTVLLAAGCQIMPTFTTGYRVGAPLASAPPQPQRLAVKRFSEARPPREYHVQGRLFLLYIPLIPWVSLDFERLDDSVNLLSEDVKKYGAHGYQRQAPPLEEYEYPASIPRAIADDLAASGLFSAVSYVGDGDTAGYRYVMTGAVRASPLVETGTSYGLGMAGVLLWFLPIPMQKTTGSVTVDLVVTDTTTGAEVWRDTLTSELSRTATMYNSAIVYGSGGAFSFNLLPLQSDVTTVDRHSLFQWHFEALRRAMEAAKPKLAQALAGA